MISDTKTDFPLATRHAPGWVKSKPESWGETAMFVTLALVFGSMIGMLPVIVADAIWLGGPGMEGANEATFSEGAPITFGTGILAALVYLMHFQILPRVAHKPIYFTSVQHQTMHQQYLTLDATSRSLAQEAYDAVAGFDNPQYDGWAMKQTDEYELITEALDIWNATYKKLKARETSGDLALHEERVETARKALDTLS